MSEIKSGDIYTCIHSKEKCVINNVIKKGKGHQISFIPDGYEYTLLTSKTQFLKEYHQ